MTTATTSGVFSNASTTTMNTWINAVCAALFTTLGVTQTSDTGQVWSSGGGATGTLPSAANTSAGYVIGRFNDSLQSSYPVFFKLEFGTGSAVADPTIWITVGTSSNGSGTINGTSCTRVMASPGNANNTGTFSSYFCYNPTYGVLWAALGVNFGGTNHFAGFAICRGSTNTGAVNTDATYVLAANAATTGSGLCEQCINYANSNVRPSTIGNGNTFVYNVFASEAFADAAAPLLMPIYYLAPTITISAVACVVRTTDVGAGSTFTAAILGSTNLTFLNIGGSFGLSTATAFSMSSTTGVSNFCLGLLWQ